MQMTQKYTSNKSLNHFILKVEVTFHAQYALTYNVIVIYCIWALSSNFRTLSKEKCNCQSGSKTKIYRGNVYIL